MQRARAWAVMEFVAQSAQAPARWQKTRSGYRLTRAFPRGNRPGAWFVAFGGAAAAASMVRWLTSKPLSGRNHLAARAGPQRCTHVRPEERKHARTLRRNT